MSTEFNEWLKDAEGRGMTIYAMIKAAWDEGMNRGAKYAKTAPVQQTTPAVQNENGTKEN